MALHPQRQRLSLYMFGELKRPAARVFPGRRNRSVDRGGRGSREVGVPDIVIEVSADLTASGGPNAALFAKPVAVAPDGDHRLVVKQAVQ